MTALTRIAIMISLKSSSPDCKTIVSHKKSFCHDISKAHRKSRHPCRYYFLFQTLRAFPDTSFRFFHELIASDYHPSIPYCRNRSILAFPSLTLSNISFPLPLLLYAGLGSSPTTLLRHSVSPDL